MSKKFIILLLFLFTDFSYGNKAGTIYIENYLGLLGNQLFQFCLGKILSEELNFQLKCPAIFGFPETYQYQNSYIDNNLPSEVLSGHLIAIRKICENKSPRNIILQGIFARYEYFKNYKHKIKDWLRFEKPIVRHSNSNDIVLHIRISTEKKMTLPFSYYEKVLSSANFDQIYICTNEPNDLFIKNFNKYNPIIKSMISLNQLMQEGKSYTEIIKLTIEDFKFIMSFNKIVIAQSTFSWWAAFLSEAQEIFAPLPDSGIMSSERPDIQLTGIEEARYQYIPCKMNNI